MKKQSIMIDMDDVITSGGFLYLLNEYLKTNYKIDDFKDFYMQDIIPNKKNFFEWFITKNQYDYCKLLPNAYEVIKELNKHYNVFIGTSYIFREIPNESSIILKQKCDYLQKNLPFIKPQQYIFIYDKSVLDIDIKIDDRKDNLKNCKRKLLFTSYHNKTISNEELAKDNIERVSGWLEIKEKLINN